jgi:hypothetical protein
MVLNEQLFLLMMLTVLTIYSDPSSSHRDRQSEAGSAVPIGQQAKSNLD